MLISILNGALDSGLTRAVRQQISVPIQCFFCIFRTSYWRSGLFHFAVDRKASLRAFVCLVYAVQIKYKPLKFKVYV